MAKYVELGQGDNREVDIKDVRLVKLLPETEQLEVAPTTETQNFKPSAEKYFDDVTVGAIQTETASVKSGESASVVLPSEKHFFDSVEVEPIVLENVVATPTTSQQSISASAGFDGIKSVTLEAVNPSDYYKPEESVSVTPLTTPQTLTPSGNSVYNKVEVGAVTSAIDGNIIPTNIRKGKTILGVVGNMEADKPDQEKVVNASVDEDVVVVADFGYELSKVTIPKVDVSQYVKEEIALDVTPSESEQVFTPSGHQVYNQVNVGAIASDYVGSAVQRVEETTYNPTTTDIVIDAGQYLDGQQIIKGDANLVAENIAEGKEVFGILGTHQGGSAKFGELVDGSISEVTGQDLGEIATIRDGAFDGATNLTTVEIPSNITTIGESAFNGCSGITTLTLAEGVTTIGANAFNGISASVIEIPRSVTTIGESAFANNTAITSVTIPDTLASLPANLFSGCTGLTEVTMEATTPPSVTDTTFPDNVTAIYVKYGAYDDYVASWTAYADKIVRLPAIPSTITVTVNNYLGELVNGASVTITDGINTYTGTTDTNGVYVQNDLQPATYTISVADIDGFKTPDSQEVAVVEDSQNSVTVTYLEVPEFSEIYGVSWVNDTTTTMTRTDDAVGMTYSIDSSTGAISSDMNDAFPWNEATVITDGSGNKFLHMPDMYFRIGKDDNGDINSVAVSKIQGGDGDWYLCKSFDYGCYGGSVSSSVLQSKSRTSRIGQVTRADLRTYAGNNSETGYTYHQLDLKHRTVMMFLWWIEWATKDSGSIMTGVVSGSGTAGGLTIRGTGNTDSLSTPSGFETTRGQMRYHYIEDFVGNQSEFVDGIYAGSRSIADYVTDNPAYFSDTSSNMVQVSWVSPGANDNLRCIMAWRMDSDKPFLVTPSKHTGATDYTQAFCDGVYNTNTQMICVTAGATYSGGASDGVSNFAHIAIDRASHGFGGRLLRQPTA